MRKLVQALVVAAALAAPAWLTLRSDEACASVAYESPYSYEQTFGTAVRLLRVDLGCKVTEKDADNGYVLFEDTSPESGKQIHKGSLEAVRGPRQRTHVSVQLPTLPSYHEQMIVDALARKLVAEHGEPPRPAKPAEPVAPDAGAAPDAQP